MQAMSEKNKTAKKIGRPRPLSPHIQVYSWLITSTLSILHRLTGVALSVGLLLIVCWLTTLAYYPESYDDFSEFLRSPIGLVMLGGWSIALYYHLCNGIRHLFWDMGRGFELKNAAISGYAVLFLTVVLTAITWAFGLGYIDYSCGGY
jgi:succinate dehydrogenase / fumarate reductase cytochrome b subunit